METQNLNFKNIVSEFLKHFPQYLKHPDILNDDYSDTPYLFFGVINRDLVANIEESKNAKEVFDVVNFVNNLYNEPFLHKDVRDMFHIEFFEPTEGSQKYKDYLLKYLTNRAHLELRRFIYIMKNGGLTDPKTGEILKYSITGGPTVRTGRYITDIK